MKTIRCPQCNLVGWTTVSFCSRCNFDISNYLNEQGILISENIERSFGENSAQYSSAGSNYQSNYSAGYGKNGSANDRQDSRRDNSNYRFEDSYNNFQDSKYGSSQRHSRNQNVNAKKGLAIWSLVLGILSLPFISVFITVLIAVALAVVLGKTGAVLGIIIGLMIPVSAIWTGIVSIKRVNRNPNQFGGKGLAIAGICCAGFCLMTVPFVAAIAVPNLLAARKAANEGSALSTLRNIAEAQKNYKSPAVKNGCAELNVLYDAKLIDPALQNGEKNGYKFATKTTENGKCSLTATPIDSADGTRAFYFSTEDNILREENYKGSPANKNSKPVNFR